MNTFLYFYTCVSSFLSFVSDKYTFISGNESLSTGYKQDTKLGFIVKALYTLAHSLHNMQRDLCGDPSAGVCPAMTPFNGKLYKVCDVRMIEEEIVRQV